MKYKRTIFLASLAGLLAAAGAVFVSRAMLSTGNNGEFCRDVSPDHACRLSMLTADYFLALTIWFLLLFTFFLGSLYLVAWVLKCRKCRGAKC